MIKKNWGFHFTQKKSTIVNFYNNKIIDGNMHPFIMRNKQFTRAHFHVFVERENRNKENENNWTKMIPCLHTFTHITKMLKLMPSYLAELTVEMLSQIDATAEKTHNT